MAIGAELVGSGHPSPPQQPHHQLGWRPNAVLLTCYPSHTPFLAVSLTRSLCHSSWSLSHAVSLSLDLLSLSRSLSLSLVLSPSPVLSFSLLSRSLSLSLPLSLSLTSYSLHSRLSKLHVLCQCGHHNHRTTTIVLAACNAVCTDLYLATCCNRSERDNEYERT